MIHIIHNLLVENYNASLFLKEEYIPSEKHENKHKFMPLTTDILH
jgi:hypothetical protein